ncbi:MAG: DUF4080 domain-containing protein [Gammaproteobacteria bacterium]|nr:DUF4080 domain-containing protein [Gammaproteobacteria bacterium]
MITLTTLNARYSHTSMGLRYLIANMGELIPQTTITEFTIQQRPIDIVEELLTNRPRIIGFGVYIWNVRETTEVVTLIKAVSPETLIILGGPEVSYEWEEQKIVQQADYLLTGMSELEFAPLCQQLISGNPPPQKVIECSVPALDQIEMPYDFYSDEDIANRVIYVEASRGCPFKCEFCLSALDKTSWPFNLEQFLAAMDRLYRRGVRRFKFVDRTFNLKVETTLKILSFFHERVDEKLHLHFELVPDHLPDQLKTSIARFPSGVLQFEIGIQTLNEEVQQRISRRQDNAKSLANLDWLRSNRVHIHADLIMGLPGETLEQFSHSFNELVRLGMPEIQVGILKRLRGSPIARHTEAFNMIYNPLPPYNLLANSTINFGNMQRLSRFARYWEMIGNSGRFAQSLPLLLGDEPFSQFLKFSDWLFKTTHQTHKINLDRLFRLIFEWLEVTGIESGISLTKLRADFKAIGSGRIIKWLQPEPTKQ